jgi:putative nucleotidyltransferase with HDIG domain
MQLLMNKISTPDLSIDEVIDCIVDPLLVSKVLKICNSSFYGLRSRVGTMREAVVYMGLKSLMSIVTVHALSGFSSRNAEQVQQILHHSMKVGMIAKQLARDMGLNHDQAFVCGLLHDLGEIIMLEVLAGYNVPYEKGSLLIEQHHTTLGKLVAKKWNFSEEIQETIRFHHAPDSAQNHSNLVELIYLADLLSKNENPPPDSALSARHASLEEEYAVPFSDHLEELDREIEAILAPA